ncbi:MAG: glycosyltransferase family A protein [Phenylobacterium sp.]|uniref:glycosyltransferase family A protein n=1 Tax=Phenylobacterium sp. TaxID=1871053 RepID=UPI00391A3634
MASAVVIPARNRASLIGRAVESALAQTLPVDEVVVVDDGSTDDTPEIVETLARRDDRVRLVRLPASGGAAAARNRGVAATRCDWICFLDSDDAWRPDKHAAQTQALEGAPDAVASFTGLRYESKDGDFEVAPPAVVDVASLRGANVVGSTSSSMVRRDAFDAVGGFDPDLPSCQDWDLWLKLRQVGAFAIVREPMVTFFQDSDGRISRNRDAVFAGHEVMFTRALEGVSGYERRKVRARHKHRLAQIMLYDFGDPAGAARAAARSLALRPTRSAVRLLWQAAGVALGGPRD